MIEAQDGPMFHQLWSYLKQQLIGDMPADIAGCADCRKTSCSTLCFHTCPRRLSELVRPEQPAAMTGARAAGD
jgi:hypothetical protein